MHACSIFYILYIIYFIYNISITIYLEALKPFKKGWQLFLDPSIYQHEF